MDQMDLLVLLEARVSLEMLDFKDLQVFQGCLDQLVLPDLQEIEGLKDSLELVVR